MFAGTRICTLDWTLLIFVSGVQMGMLTDVRVKTAELRDKEYFLNDGDGLYLRVRPTGRAWVYRYYRDGRNIKLGLGWRLDCMRAKQ